MQSALSFFRSRYLLDSGSGRMRDALKKLNLLDRLVPRADVPEEKRVATRIYEATYYGPGMGEPDRMLTCESFMLVTRLNANIACKELNQYVQAPSFISPRYERVELTTRPERYFNSPSKSNDFPLIGVSYVKFTALDADLLKNPDEVWYTYSGDPDAFFALTPLEMLSVLRDSPVRIVGGITGSLECEEQNGKTLHK